MIMLKNKIKMSFIFIIATILLINSFVICIVTAVNDDSQVLTQLVDNEFSDNEVIVVIKPFANFFDYTTDSFSEINCVEVKELTYEIEANKLCRIIKLTLADHSKQNVLNSIDKLLKRNDIHSAEPNHIYELNYISRDPIYLSGDQWATTKISLPQAWSVLPASQATVQVAVIDTGIDASHEDLKDVVNPVLSSYFTDDISTALEDTVGHGTHVAGIIGAGISTFIDNEKVGIAGIVPNVELVSLRVVNSDGIIDDEACLAAINYADEYCIPIINFSIGGVLTNDSILYSESLRTTISNYDGLFVCAAGNINRDTNVYYSFPSGFNDMPNVISVGASTSSDTKADFSNYGSATVDLFAPGESILSTYPSNLCSSHTTTPTSHYSSGYHYMDGTSMASPHVAGVAALMLSANPGLTTSQIKNIILKSVDIIDGFDDLCLSGGRLNAYKAVYTARKFGEDLTTYSPQLSSLTHNVTYNVCDDDCTDCENYDSCENCSGCEDCSNECWITYTERHNYIYTDNENGTHSYDCIDCGFGGIEINHDLYVSSESGSTIVVKCKWCSYQYTSQNPQYTQVNSNSHLVTYNTNETLTESHHFSCEPINYYVHTATCTDCGYETTEEHYCSIYNENYAICQYCYLLVPLE